MSTEEAQRLESEGSRAKQEHDEELTKLRAELEARSKNVVDKRRLLELDEQRKRAEADKMEAIKALEARSMEFMREKEEKKKLEQRINMLMGQMIKGDIKPGQMGDPQKTRLAPKTRRPQ